MNYRSKSRSLAGYLLCMCTREARERRAFGIYSESFNSILQVMLEHNTM